MDKFTHEYDDPDLVQMVLNVKYNIEHFKGWEGVCNERNNEDLANEVWAIIEKYLKDKVGKVLVEKLSFDGLCAKVLFTKDE